MSAPIYLIPAAYTGMSSWQAHRERRPPSSEPGTDYYMPTGTPLRAPAKSRVVAIGGSIHPATGRFVVLDDGTRWLRFLHLSKWRCALDDDLEAGEIFADSGASGYGSEFFGEPSRNGRFWANTGGDHVHVTAFEGRGYPAVWNGSGTVDFHALTGGKVAGGNSSHQEDIMDELIEISGKIYLLTDGAVKHCESPAHVEELKTRTGIPHTKLDGSKKAGQDQWARALDMHGVPRDVLNGAGLVKNPQSGKFEHGALWRWDRAVLAKLK